MGDQPPVKRYRREEKQDSSDDEWKVGSDSDSDVRKKTDYVPYVPVRERRKQQLVKLGRIAEIKGSEDKNHLSGLSSGASSGKYAIYHFRETKMLF